MRIIVPPLQVSEGDGFTNDIFDRHHFGQALTNLVGNSEGQGFVISLDGAWGEGKTTFIKMWQGMLKESEIPSIYIDAFASDYTSDPFLSVAGSITAYVEDNIGKDKVNDLITTAKKVGARLIPLAAKVTAKIATLGIIDQSDLEAIESVGRDIAKDTSSLVEDLVEERLKSHNKDIELIESFKSILSNTSKQLSKNKPLVIIIDELDRCKPTFAVELIEKVKHLFLVENIVFLLSMNKQQLEESIRCVYGENIEASLYLQKFINIETFFPKQSKDSLGVGDIQKYAENLIELHGFDDFIYKDIMLGSMIIFCQHFNPSLRQLERIYTAFTVFSLSEEKELEQKFIPLTILLAFVKVLNPKIFRDILLRNKSNREVYQDLRLSILSKIENRFSETVAEIIKDTFLYRNPENCKVRIETGHNTVDKIDLIFYFTNKINLFSIM